MVVSLDESPPLDIDTIYAWARYTDKVGKELRIAVPNGVHSLTPESLTVQIGSARKNQGLIKEASLQNKMNTPYKDALSVISESFDIMGLDVEIIAKNFTSNYAPDLPQIQTIQECAASVSSNRDKVYLNIPPVLGSALSMYRLSPLLTVAENDPSLLYG